MAGKRISISGLPYKLVVICGLHRSGTTYVGKTLSKNAKVTVVYEPLNAEFGVKGVPVVYPYISPDAAGDDVIAKLFDDVCAFKRKWNRKPGTRKRGIATLPYRLFGGRRGLRWIELKLRALVHSYPEVVCWKDPFTTLSAGYLMRHYGAKVVCLVRHPGAFYSSVLKQGWQFDINNIRMQKNLCREYGEGISNAHWDSAISNNIISLAIVWKVMARVISDYSSRFSQLMILRHEDFCASPLFYFRKICGHLGLDCTSNMERYIENTTQAEGSIVPDGEIHYFRRNSKDIIDSWRGRIDVEEESVLREVIGEELYRFYSKW